VDAGTLSILPEDSETSWPLSEYMVPAQDSHGHSAKVVIRLPPGLKRQMSIIVSRHVFPFETDTDIARWCLFVGIKALRVKMRDPEISSLHSMTETWKSQAQYNMEHAHFEDILTTLRSTIDSLLSRKALRAARKMIVDVREGLGELDAYWKRKYESEIISKYSFLFSKDNTVRKVMRKRGQSKGGKRG